MSHRNYDKLCSFVQKYRYNNANDFSPHATVNVPMRDYQLSIARSALFSNTLVALPTGLGKTLIAAVVMYNYFRWFPEGNFCAMLLLL